MSSAVVKTIGEAEGSRILARPEKVEGKWLQAALANLGVMYETIQAVSHILDLNQLLDRILELVFQSIEADRGCVMLRATSPDGTAAADLSSGAELEPKAVRWRGGVSRQEKIPVSRTVMDHVLREKQGVLVSDAIARRALPVRAEHRPLRRARSDLRADEGAARDAGRHLPRQPDQRPAR